MRYYSKTTGVTYIPEVHGDQMPEDAVPIDNRRYLEVIANPAPGKIRSHDADGLPILIDPPPYSPTVDELCTRIDTAADAARTRAAGDPLRAVEYDRARAEAEQFAAADYQGDIPPMVAAWAINGRSAQEAADDILREAGQYTAALVLIREIRLAAKEQVRALMGEDKAEEAQQVADDAVSEIQSAVDGVGNAK